MGGGCGGGQEIRFPGSTLLGVSAQDFLPPLPMLWSCPMPRDPLYPGICRDPEIQPHPQDGGGAGWEFRSQGRAQGPAGNTESWPGQPPSLNSGSLGTSGGGRGRRGLGIIIEASPGSQDWECILRVRENGTKGQLPASVSLVVKVGKGTNACPPLPSFTLEGKF